MSFQHEYSDEKIVNEKTDLPASLALEEEELVLENSKIEAVRLGNKTPPHH
jgi:hypothetical protein